ncbi:MAG: hypothetical protein A2W79_08455 [Pseudomonadales bacterium RIFCSPLOWO2_12_60_38]|uniref:phosphoribosyltransferase-like protein n=1 Tax=Pseudomonas TaxID=286 RepID=UPI0003DCF500|nr:MULTISPECIES: hypothetical protein [unclassified Pseudomonas]ETK41848.1 hypothetical protein H098_09680 [Pseudomonas fluorescens FH5]OHC33532.1 MAG: hypothetical protein A2W79_08455 [Pseudomonadales bacterium RIFCSPLOWO2_12_60_38]OHC40564.1 MAG: hypothetical protein A3G72_15570 [Pseudomonadales bacterium RIFCSPLOWO2_12_FULL_59_450]PTT11553.1 hypothetical protein DBR14_13090 [Pseudomonas sp. HMWF034]PVV70660.1 hypothetical protein DD985_15050 [Pseudomonas sp. HMWF011]
MINALPSSIASEIERVERAVGCWPTSVPIDHVIRWVLQFDRDDYGLAIRILENIDVLAQRDVRAAFEVAQAKLERAAIEKGAPIKKSNTLYAGVGQASKSGAVMAYHYRLAAQVSESDFFTQDEEDEIDFSQIENIVLLDDVIGTGQSVATDIARVIEEVHSLTKSRNVYVLTVAGYVEGISKLVNETGASIISALEYSTKDTVNDLDAPFYNGLPMSERARTLDRIKRYCRIAARSDLGYGNIGGLLVFDHNTPNTSLPLIWARGNGWMPLFARAGRIQGTAKVFKEAKAEREAEASQLPPAPEHVPNKSAIDLTLFVEGKFDERFVDVMRARFGLAKRLGVGDVNAVALGGVAQSGRLFELLRESRKYAVFVLEGDPHSLRMARRIEPSSTTKVMHLKPSFVALLDLQKVKEAVERFPGLPEPAGEFENEKWLSEVERVLKRGSMSASSERTAQIVEEYLDPVKYEAFVQELAEYVNQLLARV